jgi:hypothetical protein
MIYIARDLPLLLFCIEIRCVVRLPCHMIRSAPNGRPQITPVIVAAVCLSLCAVELSQGHCQYISQHLIANHPHAASIVRTGCRRIWSWGDGVVGGGCWCQCQGAVAVHCTQHPFLVVIRGNRLCWVLERISVREARTMTSQRRIHQLPTPEVTRSTIARKRS